MSRRRIVVQENHPSDSDEGPVDVMVINVSEDLFYSVWSTGLFGYLNEHARTLIDDYEDSSMEGEALDVAVEVIENIAAEKPQCAEFLGQFASACRLAKERGAWVRMEF
jgi:hypothetical protein